LVAIFAFVLEDLAMKVVVIAILVSMLGVTNAIGQVRGKAAGTAEAVQAIQESKQQAADQQRQLEKWLQNGGRLFGGDKRWNTNGNYAGTLAAKRPPDFGVDDWGCTNATFETLSKVSETEYLLLPKYKDSQAMLVRGLDAARVTDGVEFILQHPVVIEETFSYVATNGSKKTVLVLDTSKFDGFIAKQRAAIEAAQEEAKKAAEEALTRKWTTNEATFVAKFVSYENYMVRLQKKDQDETVEFSMSKLSKADQKWIRDLLHQRVLEKQKQQKAQKPARF
jgi:hypothetical protein